MFNKIVAVLSDACSGSPDQRRNKRMEYHWRVSVSLATNSMYYYSACIKCLIRDVFDVAFEKELKVLYRVCTCME